ncbi:MAG: hypothetical protein GEV11_07585 [Streptosporangiales bacterium]|nr:hypothetical protein [Streptosporangiales bacterium]
MALDTPLNLAVTGPDHETAEDAAARLRTLAAGAPVTVISTATPDPGAFHLVIAVSLDDADGDAADVRVAGEAALDELWRGRLEPFAANLARRGRAPRRQQAVLAGPDPTWPAQVRRLMVRVARAAGPRAHRIDHIGSTSVPGLPAKDIIDLQVVVDDLDTAVAAAADARHAGFVHVVGPFYGIDRHGAHHDEQVAVDADPGRPVNVHFHPVASPIWRELLLLRDWLRAEARNREEYAAVKRGLAARPGHDVNDYSVDKMPWIADALSRAEAWARTG